MTQIFQASILSAGRHILLQPAMATIVHRAPSAIHDHQPTPIIPQRRPREPSIEVIDVDQLDEMEYMPRPRSGARSPNPPSQRRRTLTSAPDEVIVLDSDDEEYNPSVLGSNFGSSQSGSSQVNSRDISPPAWSSAGPPLSTFPRLEDNYTSSVPMRRYPPSFPSYSAPVIADPMASDYERFLQNNTMPRVPPSSTHASGSGTRLGTATSDANGSATPPSSQPLPDTRASRAAFRAGGGLITSVRAHAAERRAERARMASLRASGVPRSRYRVNRAPSTITDNMYFVGLFGHDSLDPFESLGFNGLIRYGPGYVHPTHPPKIDEPDYRAEYTHPQPAGSGFCFDFDPSSSQENKQSKDMNTSTSRTKPMPVSSQENPIVLDDDGEIVHEPEVKLSDADVGGSGSSPPVSISLVCSKCFDPLLLGEGASAVALRMAAAGASAERVESERKARRIWGLRCGHLIDGKCLEVLGYPEGALDAQKKDVKGKGKGKSLLDPADATDREVEKDEPHLRTFDANPIRSRLRSASHHNGPTTISNNRSSSSNSHDDATANSTAPPPRFSLGASIARRYLPTPIVDLFSGDGHGSSKMKQPRKPRIQQTHFWTCPVNRCGKAHTSVKVDGVWGPENDKGEGAIPLFI
ncbi:hypothetical protein F5050DRAFT_1794367 [Lentinula boryana]|uniref:Uncharacterized protein n=1 Tax=Lentinula boryana TaxID=40481 RepID=A0ABQ8PY81_9AGAR|nr:hypothetical protein F5050DRAFT_1794367 [Lentinula boryana]